MDSFFDKFSRNLAMSRRDSLLLMLSTAGAAFLAACGSNGSSCSSAETACGSGCCSSTQSCCSSNGSNTCCSGYCCGTGCCSFGAPVCCGPVDNIYCCSAGETCGGGGTCLDPDGVPREARPAVLAIPVRRSLW